MTNYSYNTTNLTNASANIGDIYCCSWGHDARKPFWGMIVGKRGSTFIMVQPMKDVAVKGRRNGYRVSLPSDEKDGRPYKTSLYEMKDGLCFKNPKGRMAFKWDGKTPLYCPY